MAVSIWEGKKADRLIEGLENLNAHMTHLNADMDLYVSDKRAALVTDMATLAIICTKGEILDVMDYGDQISPAWADGEINYSPAMNLCHEGDAELEDGETIHGAFFEWDKTTPFGVQFSHQRAILAVMHKVTAALASGATCYWHHIAASTYVSFVAPAAISAGQWLNYQNGQIEIYDASGQLLTRADAKTAASAPAGTNLGDAPTMPAGDYYFTFAAAWGNNVQAGGVVSFTLDTALQFGEKICGIYGAPDKNRSEWKIYVVTDDGKTLSEAINVGQDTSGTALGAVSTTERNVSGAYLLNRLHEIAYGYNRWAFSALRQYLNSTAAANEWWRAADAWDVRPDQLTQKAGFLAGYAESVYRYMQPIKVVTVAPNADQNVEDVTYDKVFLSSLEQMYMVPQFAAKEGEYWEYYKHLHGRTEPAPTSKTYPRLIKYALNTPASAQGVFRRSAYRAYAYYAWGSGPTGYVYATYAYGAFRCAPACFIGD